MPVFNSSEELEIHVMKEDFQAGSQPEGLAKKGIKILAEGDSWFKYPRQFFLVGGDSNIIDWLGNEKDKARVRGNDRKIFRSRYRPEDYQP